MYNFRMYGDAFSTSAMFSDVLDSKYLVNSSFQIDNSQDSAEFFLETEKNLKCRLVYSYHFAQYSKYPYATVSLA